MEKNENILLWPLMRRILGWAFVMACSWGWRPFLFGGKVGLLVFLALSEPKAPTPYEEGNPAFFLLIFGVPLFLTCLWVVGGAVTGAFAGALAPANEPKNPLKSPFFRSVGKETFCFWLLPTLGLFFIFFPLLTQSDNWLGLYLLSLFAVFIASLRRALNRALKPSKAKSLVG